MNLLSIDLDVTPEVRLIGHVNYTAPWKHFRRILNEYVMYVIKSGELYIQEGDNYYSLKKNDMFILEPNIEHVGFKESCCSYYYIHFSHKGISNIINKTSGEITNEISQKRRLSLISDIYSNKAAIDSAYYLPKHYNCGNYPDLFSKLSEADYVFYEKLEYYKQMASLKFSELLIEICRQYASNSIENLIPQFSKSALKVRDIIVYFEKNYSSKITSGDIESLFEANFDYLNRVFKTTTGQTIFNYLNLIRIKKAVDLINTTSLKYGEIGYLVGINDPYYFSKLFKKYIGMTASQYAKLRYNPNT